MSADVDAIEAWWQSQDPTRSPRFDRAAFACGAQADVELLRMQQTAAQLSVTDTTFETRRGRGHRAGRRRAALQVPRLLRRAARHDRAVRPGWRVSTTGPVSRSSTSAPAPASRARPSRPTSSCTPWAPLPSPGPQHSCGVEDPAHACDSNLDIMWPFATLVPFSSLLLDVNRDDYYAHSGTWVDIQDTRFLRRLDAQGSLALTLSGTGSVVSDIPGVSCATTCATQWDTGSERHAHRDAGRRAALRALGRRLRRLRAGTRLHGVDRTGDAGQCAVRPADVRAPGRRERQGDGARRLGARLVPLALRRRLPVLHGREPRRHSRQGLAVQGVVRHMSRDAAGLHAADEEGVHGPCDLRPPKQKTV